jgi:asparagine synthase (glutamine-hydrolysing)
LAAKKSLPPQTSAKKKLGFPVPIRVWLKTEKYYNIVKKAFTSPTAEKFFDVVKLLQLLDTHKSGKADLSRKIWTVFTFLVWHEQFFKNE